MRILDDGLIVDDEARPRKLSNRTKTARICAPLLAGAIVIYAMGYQSEKRLPSKWRQEIREIASQRQNGFYQSADLRASYLVDGIREYERDRERGDTFNAFSLKELSEVKFELNYALSLKDTNNWYKLGVDK